MSNEIFESKLKEVRKLFETALENYIRVHCPCAFPRFRQVIGVDCSDTDDSFRCWETEVLINASKKYFDTTKTERNAENASEQWICPKCQSRYEYGWSDFSIAVDRQTVKMTDLKAAQIGKNIQTLCRFTSAYTDIPIRANLKWRPQALKN